MATSAMMMEWGLPIAGREGKAVEVFYAALQYWGGLQKAGKIESFRYYSSLSGNFMGRVGLLIVEGTDDQIDRVMKSEEFRVMNANVMAVAQNYGIAAMETGDRVAAAMTRYGKSVKQILG